MLSPPSAGGVDFNPRPPCGGRRFCRGAQILAGIFQSTSSVWRTTFTSSLSPPAGEFQSTSSVWRTTNRPQAAQHVPAISIPVLRVEDDPGSATAGYTAQVFQSTSSVWRTTWQGETHPPQKEISIHVLRVEDDTLTIASGTGPQAFQSTSSVWRTTLCPALPGGARLFQSTSSVWRTTFNHRFCLLRHVHFNPRPPCGGRLDCVAQQEGGRGISIHVLRVEDDSTRRFTKSFLAPFQSTSSVWRTTSPPYKRGRPPRCISIHVLRVEDDLLAAAAT